MLATGGGTPAAGGGAANGGNGGEAADTSGANTGGAPNTGCAIDASGLRLTSAWDEFGYPSYAIDGCRLVYVAEDASLRLRNLENNEELELEPGASRPRRPTLKGDTLAWEVSQESKPVVRVWTETGAITLSGAFDHAGEPAAANGAVVFTAFKAPGAGADSDVLLYDVGTGVLSEIFAGPGQQRFPAISSSQVAATDFSEDPRGYFDEVSSVSDIIVRARAGGDVVPRPRSGKQAFPMLSDDGTLAYLDWAAVHPEPKFSAFNLYVTRVGALASEDQKIRAIETDPSYVRPSLNDQVIDFVDRSSGKPLLYRISLDGIELAPLVDFGSSVIPLGPIARNDFTLIATRAIEGARLRVVAR